MWLLAVLHEAMQVREVDLVTERSLTNPVLKAEINAIRVLLYGG